MKKVMTLIIALAFGINLQAQESTSYEQYMLETIHLYDSVKTMDDYKNILHRFERIAAAESTEWLPNYYAGLTYIYMSFVGGLEEELRDDYLDKALEAIEKAQEIKGETSEILVLKGYVYMAKVSISPALRGMTLSGKVSAYFEKALAMDPQNPRANLMAGRWKYGSAQFFGSSTDDACALMQKALELFQAQDNAETIEPSWGENQAQAMTKRCEGNK